MTDNLITSFDNFNKKQNCRLTKKDIRNLIVECLSNSKLKMNVNEISKITGQKPDKVYVALTDIKAKSKVIECISYWYINENQSDPIKKTIIKKSGIDKTFIDLNSVGDRKVFLTMEDYQLSKEKSKRKINI